MTSLIFVIFKLIQSTSDIVKKKPDQNNLSSFRVIADHLRAVAFAIADGQLPSNTGAGYVIRRILRRAIRYGFTFLNQKEPFIHLLVKTLSQQMGASFPELIKEQQLAYNVIKEEENSFLKTLDQGLVLLESIMANSKTKNIEGSKAFELTEYSIFLVCLDFSLGQILSSLNNRIT